MTQILTPAQLHRVAPSVFATEAHSSRSDKFVPVSTANVLDALLQEGFYPVKASQSRCRDAQRRDFTKHVVRLRHQDQLQNPVLVGGSVPEILITNANDGASSFSVGFGLYRLVCSNGLVVGKELASHATRHTGNGVLDNVIEGVYKVLEQRDEVLGRVERWSGIATTTDQQFELASRVAVARWGVDENGNIQTPLRNPSQLLTPRRREDTATDAFVILNRIQENVIRGGLPGRSESGRRVRTRAVSSVNEDLRINRAIWNIAE